MRLFEILICLFLLPAITLLLFAPAARRVYIACCLITAILLVIHAIDEGPHWQIFPLYLSSLALLGYAAISVLTAFRLPRLGSILLAVVCLLLLATSLFLSWLAPMFRLPKPTGQFAVGTRILHLVDTSRPETGGPSPSGKRELIVQAWYPAQPPSFWTSRRATYQRRKEVTLRASYRSVLRTHAFQDAPVLPNGPYPVILYNPGWMGERTEGTYLMEELASHGFLVIAIDHTFYGGLVEFPDGRVANSQAAPPIGNFENSTVAEQWALGNKYVHIEAQDDSFVLDQFAAMNQDPASPWFHALDMDRVGVTGFSIGGAVAAQTAYQDQRIRAALNMDGWTFGDVALHGLAKPFLLIYEDKAQTIPTPQQLTSGTLAERMYWEVSQQDNDNITASLNQNGGSRIFINGTNHVDFTDRSLFSPLLSKTGGGSVKPARVHAIVNAYTLAFFSHVLRGSTEPLLQASPSPFPEVEQQNFPPQKPK